MEVLLLLLSPFVVAIITSGIKHFRPVSLTEGAKKYGIRFVVAILSFAAVVGSAIVSGGEVDPIAIETFSTALMVFLSSTGVYFFAKKK